MNKDQQEQVLQRMKAAIRTGRDERVETRSILDHHLEESLQSVQGYRDIDTARDVIKEAKGRKLLATARTRTPEGEVKTVELGQIKQREPYQKRPSVRALKRSRQASMSGPSV